MGVYNKAKAEVLRGNLDFVNDTIRALLVDNTYSFDPDDDFVADISAFELAVTNYSRVELGGKTVTEDDINNKGFFDSDDEDFVDLGNGVNATTAGLVLFKFVTDDSDSFLIGFIPVAFTTQGITIRFVWSVSGILEAV